MMRHNLPERHDIPNQPPLPKSLSFFFSKNPAAKMFRHLSQDHTKNKFENFQEILTTSNLTEGPLNMTKKINLVNIWTLSFLPLDLKEFALFHFNNKHILNLYRARFTPNISPECSFCKRFPTIGKIWGESYEHFFLNSQTVKPLADLYFTHLFSFQLDHRTLLSRGCQEDRMTSLVVNIELLLFDFYIFEIRNKNRIPTFTNLLHVSYKRKKQLLASSQKYSLFYTKICSKYGNAIKLHNRLLENY